jgi:hypothetical protein
MAKLQTCWLEANKNRTLLPYKGVNYLLQRVEPKFYYMS